MHVTTQSTINMKIIDEAVQDARQIQEAATKIAQDRLVDALRPRLKKIIESKLLAEEGINIDELIDDLENDEYSASDYSDYEAAESEAESEAEAEDEYEEENIFNSENEFKSDHDIASYTLTSDDDYEDEEEIPVSDLSYEVDEPKVQINASGEIEIEIDLGDNDNDTDADDYDDHDKILTGAEVIEAKEVMKNILKASSVLKQRSNRVKNHKDATRIVESADSLKSVVTTFMRSSILTSNDASASMLQEAFTALTTTQERMENAMRRQKITEKRHMEGMKHYKDMDMDEMDDVEELDELDAVLNLTPNTDEESEMLDDLGLALDDLMIDVSVEDENDEDDELDIDLEDFEVSDEDEDFDEDDDDDMDAEADDDDEVLEVDESVLRQAISEMRRDRGASARHFSVNEDNSASRQRRRRSSHKSSARRTRRITEKRNDSSSRHQDRRNEVLNLIRENKQLKRHLKEMNLFSAKLLYVNKFFNGKNVTAKQRRGIVEAMDNAKTLREAKLLYRSLLKTSGNKVSNKQLSESRVRVIGSSSRSTPSAQPAKNGVEVDRWATLAGLMEGK